MVQFLHFFLKLVPTHAGSSALAAMVWPFVIPDIFVKPIRKYVSEFVSATLEFHHCCLP